METTILVDIDGVLAKSNVSEFAKVYAQTLKLTVSDEELCRTRTWADLDALPAAMEHKERVGIERYDYQLEALRWHPHCVVSCDVIDGAVSGVNYLAQRVDTLKYCTARVINFNAEWNTDVARMTHIWLQNNIFPNNSHVLFCDGILAKLERVAVMVRERAQHVLLIDDSAESLLTAFDELSKDDQRVLRRSLTLVAFGYKGCDGECPLRVVPFPGWHEVHNLAVAKEFNYGY